MTSNAFIRTNSNPGALRQVQPRAHEYQQQLRIEGMTTGANALISLLISMNSNEHPGMPSTQHRHGWAKHHRRHKGKLSTAFGRGVPPSGGRGPC
jgi:hypothetical protein